MACFGDAIFSIRLFDGDWNWASAEVRVSFPHLMTEAPEFFYTTHYACIVQFYTASIIGRVHGEGSMRLAYEKCSIASSMV